MIQPFQIARGWTSQVPRLQVRAFLQASYTVLGFHGLYPSQTVRVELVKNLFLHDVKCIGVWFPGVIQLDRDNDPETMLTACLHEAIHSVIAFPDGTDEKCTSTLCARLKPDVHRVAEILLENIYQRAAYIAHTKIAYVAKDGDYYDQDQCLPVGVQKYRK